MKTLNRILAAFLLTLPSLALAHTGEGAHGGFAAGVGHPLGGLDHLLAMVAVGCWAAHLGGKALWQLPVAFVGAMLLGGALGMLGVAVPMMEAMILASSVVIGLALAISGRLNSLIAASLCALFAIFHGAAHGLEMPNSGSAFGYALGFALATAVLHLTGLASGKLSQELAGRSLERWLGGAIAVAGLGLAFS
ncbi:HupE/UreJ family protein [Saccharospirillum mangrovi]|uniref:HupE/UreJ family protein n=1 Tax=Saccharospirillum mangrovi TaxID=2161747 RepID=UPI000D3A49CB|nr:HupE/UreJ family protein [Saccharospirillum mangrovi]